MKRDDHLIFESIVSKYSDTKPITNYAIRELEKMHEKLNSLSTAIELARQPEIDQVLSKIRDLADMLISDSKFENEETPEQRIAAAKAKADEIKQQVKGVKLGAQMKYYGDGLKQALGKEESNEEEHCQYAAKGCKCHKCSECEENASKSEEQENPATATSAVQQPIKHPLNPVQMNAINMTAKAFNIPVNQATKLAQVIQAYQQAQP